jgi:hypothetical protein
VAHDNWASAVASPRVDDFGGRDKSAGVVHMARVMVGGAQHDTGVDGVAQTSRRGAHAARSARATRPAWELGSRVLGFQNSFVKACLTSPNL